MTRSFTATLLVAAASFLSGCNALFGGSDDGNTADQIASLAQCEVIWDIRNRMGRRIHVPIEPKIYLADFELTADGEWVTGNGSPCAIELAGRLGDICDLCNADPGACEVRLHALFDQAPAACAVCGDGQCFESEDENSCPADCRENCGDNFCSDGETPIGCPVDCGTGCGDGLCNAPEDQLNCAVDCSFTAGDGLCGPGEDAINSPIDCGRQTCGDAFCQSYESALRCPEDCCLPRGCEPGAEACGSDGTIVQCVASDQEDCSEWQELEPCEHGCVPTSEGPRCRTCAEIAEAFFGHTAFDCDLATYVPSCTGSGAQQCVPVPGFNGCGHIVQTECACVDGVCADNCEAGACGGRYLACDEDGDITRCRNVAASMCEYREAYYDCPPNAQCTEFPDNSASCCPADACTTDGIYRCIDGVRSEVCRVDEGDYCGVWEEVEACGEGSGCEVGAGIGEYTCQGCCDVGTARCYTSPFGHDVIASCEAAVEPADCGRWVDRGVCEGISRCDDSTGAPSCVPR
jgi:hypothetical protein